MLENLNDLQADVVLIKNIDNVTVEDHIGEVARYKRILGGYLIDIQNRIFEYLDRIQAGNCNRPALNEITHFVCHTLGHTLSEGASQDCLMDCLNRPVRVCGMVRNTGEPGGGPFWVRQKDGSLAPQIIESAQVDMTSDNQQDIWSRSTHFNPVDLACGVRDHTGRPFDLLHYRDPETGFISMKSQADHTVKAMELPGLWNGSMARWNTIFVEVPLITFNPVKTVEDLLKPEHKPL